jgi:hypothetical protein
MKRDGVRAAVYKLIVLDQGEVVQVFKHVVVDVRVPGFEGWAHKSVESVIHNLRAVPRFDVGADHPHRRLTDGKSWDSWPGGGKRQEVSFVLFQVVSFFQMLKRQLPGRESAEGSSDVTSTRTWRVVIKADELRSFRRSAPRDRRLSAPKRMEANVAGLAGFSSTRSQSRDERFKYVLVHLAFPKTRSHSDGHRPPAYLIYPQQSKK